MSGWKWSPGSDCPGSEALCPLRRPEGPCRSTMDTGPRVWRSPEDHLVPGHQRRVRIGVSATGHRDWERETRLLLGLSFGVRPSVKGRGWLAGPLASGSLRGVWVPGWYSQIQYGGWARSPWFMKGQSGLCF